MVPSTLNVEGKQIESESFVVLLEQMVSHLE